MRHFESVEGYLASGDRLTVGQMSELCCVSKRALRLYDERGLVTPAFVDEETGYRFYSIDQVPLIDRVNRLQNMGFSLRDTKQLIDGLPEREAVRLFERQREILRGEIDRLSMAEEHISRQMNGMLSGTYTPYTRIPLIEWFPEQRVVDLDIRDLDIRIGPQHSKDAIYRWYYALMKFKRSLQDKGLPDAAFNEVSTVIARSDLIAGDFIVSRARIVLGAVIPRDFRAYELVPAGHRVTCYADSFYNDNGENTEWRGLVDILAYAADQGLEITGDYVGVGNIDVPMHVENERRDRLSFTVPVNW